MTCFDILNIEYNEEGYLLDFRLPDTMRICVKEGDNWSHTEEAIRKQINNMEELYANDVKVVDFSAFYEGTDEPLRGNYEDYDTHGEYAFMQAEEGKTRTFVVSSVDYDTGQIDDLDLPQDFTLTLDIDEIGDTTDMQEIADYLVEDISDETGWLVEGFYFQEKMPDGTLVSLDAEDLEFTDWANQESKSHGKVSLKEWADNEIKKHGGKMSFQNWAKHENKSHTDRFGAEDCEYCGTKEEEELTEIREDSWDGPKVLVCDRCLDIAMYGAESEEFEAECSMRDVIRERYGDDYNCRSQGKVMVREMPIFPPQLIWDEQHKEKIWKHERKPSCAECQEILWDEFGGMVDAANEKMYQDDYYGGHPDGDYMEQMGISEDYVIQPFEAEMPKREKYSFKPKDITPYQEAGWCCRNKGWGSANLYLRCGNSRRDITQYMISTMCMPCLQSAVSYATFEQGWAEDTAQFESEEWNWGGDPKGQLATAIRKARIKAKKPRKPLKIEKLDAEQTFRIATKHGAVSSEDVEASVNEMHRLNDFVIWVTRHKLHPDTLNEWYIEWGKHDEYRTLDAESWGETHQATIEHFLGYSNRYSPTERIEDMVGGSYGFAEEDIDWLSIRWYLNDALTNGNIMSEYGEDNVKEALEMLKTMNAETSDYEKLEYIHSTLQDCDGDDVMIETSLGFVEDLREPHFKAETSGQWEIGEQLEEAQMNAEFLYYYVLNEKGESPADFDTLEEAQAYVANSNEPLEIYERRSRDDEADKMDKKMNAEDQNKDLLKWIEDYLWDNDKKGYQAYHAHRKSLGLNAEDTWWPSNNYEGQISVGMPCGYCDKPMSDEWWDDLQDEEIEDAWWDVQEVKRGYYKRTCYARCPHCKEELEIVDDEFNYGESLIAENYEAEEEYYHPDGDYDYPAGPTACGPCSWYGDYDYGEAPAADNTCIECEEGVCDGCYDSKTEMCLECAHDKATVKEAPKGIDTFTEPFEESSLDSGTVKSIAIGMGLGLLGCFGYSKWK